MPCDIDPLAFAHRADPYPVYRILRDEAPVQWSETMDCYCVSRFDDVQHVLKSPDDFSSRAMFTLLMNNGSAGVDVSWAGIKFAFTVLKNLRMMPWNFVRSRILIASDGDRHSSMRGILNRGFTPREIQRWDGRVRAIVEESLEPLREGEPFDLMEDLAVRVPVTVVAELLGVEKARQPDFKRWSDAVIYNATGPGRERPFNAEFISTMSELFDYFGAVIDERSAAPTDDLIGQLLTAQKGDQDPLSPLELVMFITLLMVAGNETTTNAIGNGARALLAHPEQLSRVAADPTLAARVVEETLRYDAPVQTVFRTATRDTEVGGTRIPKGAFVAALIGSANRDERRFVDADRFDIDRETQGHLGFGLGKHFCLGASLARLQARTAIEALAPELLQVSTDPAKHEHVDSFLVRGLRSLPLRQGA